MKTTPTFIRSLATGFAGLLFCSGLAIAQPAPGTGPGAEAAKARFAKVDTDGDGQLSRAEFQQTRIAQKVPDPAAAFARIDADSNGFLTKEEIRNAVRERHAQRDGGPNQQKPETDPTQPKPGGLF